MAGIVSFGPNSSNRPITVNQTTVTGGGGSTSGLVPYTGATGDVNLGTNRIIAHAYRAHATDGARIESANGTLVGFLGPANTANATWYGAHNFSERVSADAALGADIILNGGFASAASWTAPTGWSISGGVATHGSNGIGALVQSAGSGPTPGTSYVLTFTVSGLTVGSVNPSMGGRTFTTRSANGTYTETFTATSSAQISFAPTNTSRFSIDNVSATPVTGGGFRATNSRSANISYTGPTSAPFEWETTAWKSSSVAAAQNVNFSAVARGITGAATVSGEWALTRSINGSTPTDVYKIDSAGQATQTVGSSLGATTGFRITHPFSNGTPGTTRALLLDASGSHNGVEFNYGGVLRQAFIGDNGGQMSYYASGGSFHAFYSGNSGLTTNQLFAYLYPTALIHSSGYGAFQGGVMAGGTNAPGSTLRSAGSFATKVVKKTANFTADALAATYICNPSTASCIGTPSVTTCATYAASGQAVCESHLPCSWFAGSSCSAFDNESGMTTCAGTSGCTVATASCAGAGDQSACEAQDDAYGGSCSWGATGDCTALGSGTCASTTGCTETPDDCANYSDGGGDGTACNGANGGSYCSYDSGTGACSGGTFGFLSCSGTYDECSGTYNTGSCTGTYGAACSGTATCSGYASSGTCNAEAGCNWTTGLTATLPPITDATDRIYTFYNADSGNNDVVIVPTGSDTVNHTTSYTLSNFKDFATVQPLRDTADCSTFTSAGTCTPTGCSVNNSFCSYDTETNLCAGNAVCPAHDGNQANCEAQSYFSSCSGTYVVSSNWYVTGR